MQNISKGIYLIKLLKYFGIVFLLIASLNYAQKDNKHMDVFVDEQGVMRWKNTNEEVSLFGVNYTAPFAYSYRAHKRLGLSIKKAIDLDVAQMVRLGLDAFRVHVWDREISDKDGNVIKNEHLDLFDYLLSKLADNRIKIIVTPIAWWGNGWPEPDEKTNGFSQLYSKLEMITNQTARAAQRNYLEQFVNHINPYRKFAYKNDPSIIAVEIINEPHHPEDAHETTNYINEMVKVLRDAGFTKPLFYNISENWNDTQAQAVCNADIQGVSFQWYPTELVHGKMLQGNYLINVNKYLIPSDKISGYNSKAKMVYEFDAADIGASYMYPAMARSFREAGMQFATMFSYDPVQIAWSNTEYPTHYLNLLYTPQKAIGLMIASKVFHEIPRMKSFGNYPENNRFDNFRVSYDENLSEMNSDTALYYSNNTQTVPKNAALIKHIAGTGNSFIVKYDGTGAYFLDKLAQGLWRLEVYPDVLWLRDPFEKTSMSRQVARLYWNERQMNIMLPELGENFSLYSINSIKEKEHALQSAIHIKPGIYLVASANIKNGQINKYLSKKEIFLDGLYIPPKSINDIEVVNKTNLYSPESSRMDFKFEIAGGQIITNANMFVRRPGWRGFEKHSLKNINGFDYVPEDSIKILRSGELEYCVSVETGGKVYTFPGGEQISPESWDYTADELWKIKTIDPEEPLALFDVSRDRRDFIFPQYSKSMRYLPEYKNGSGNENKSLSVNISFTEENNIPFGLQLNVSGLIKSFNSQLNNYQKFVVRARSTQNAGTTIRLILLTGEGINYSAAIELKNNWQDIEIPFNQFKNNYALILPFSYPQFLPKIWDGKDTANAGYLSPGKIEYVQIVCDKSSAKINNGKMETGFEIESIYLKTINKD
jgi:hypothetical protein